MRKKIERLRGLSLVEILIVTSILALMLLWFVGTIDSISIFGKGWDARRKKDLGRIKMVFEEYYNDKGCYPTKAQIESFNSPDHCGKPQMGLEAWPCDANDIPYLLYTEETDCPKWFKALTNLDNKKDSSIPGGWYSKGALYRVGDGKLAVEEANYGISSTNVNWFDYTLNPACDTTICSWNCDSVCNGAPGGCIDGQNGMGCYATNHSGWLFCRVPCCGPMCN